MPPTTGQPTIRLAQTSAPSGEPPLPLQGTPPQVRLTAQIPHEYPLRSVYEWFRLNPHSEQGPTIAFTPGGGPPVVMTAPATGHGARGSEEDDEDDVSEDSSLVRRYGAHP